jgi:MSHA pilin protein MshA
MKMKGFTLVELVIVIIILGILAVVAMPKFVDLTGAAKTAACQGILGGVRSAIAIDYAQYAANNSGSTRWLADGSLLGPLMSDGKIAGNPANANKTNIITQTGATTTRSNNTAYGWGYNKDSGDFWAPNNTDW